MYLKRLELIGFKSFAQKTVLDFPTGVTAVVGPNGSGKSNIIDAMRWILGESSAKNVRAEKAEQLIYNGAGGRAKAGFAQVTITFDNSQNIFPIDFKEVDIRRRVDRKGNSQYFVNNTESRLRDIVDLFSKVRLGTKGFSIINQGNSDIFIRANPAERRVMLEEVLGLRQYQIKKHEAENKLNGTKFNLEKTKGLVEELLPHLRVLRRQTKKWEKHDDLIKELGDLENKYFGSKLYEIEKSTQGIDPEIKKVEDKIKEETIELNKRKENLSSIEKKQPQGDVNFNKFKGDQEKILGRRSEIQKELGRLEAELEFLLRQPKESVKEAELLGIVGDTRKIIQELVTLSDLDQIKFKLKELDKKIDDILTSKSKKGEARQSEIKKLKDEFTKELEDLEKNLKDLDGLESKLADDLKEFNVEFKKAFELVEEKRRQVSDLESQKSRLGFDRERVDLKLQDLKDQAVRSGRNISDFKSIKEDVNIDEVERKLLKIRGDLASIGEIDQEMIKEAKDTEVRYEFLSTQIADLEKASEDLRGLITELKQKIHDEFSKALHLVNQEFNEHFRVMFGGGKAKLHLIKNKKARSLLTADDQPPEEENKEFDEGGLEIDLSIPKKNIKGLDMLSGGERSLVSIAVLFALISVSPPPFLVLDEIDAALDESNTKRFADLIKVFSKKSQFVLVTHNRATMGAAKVLYGVTMRQDGTSRLLSIKLEEAIDIN